MKICTVEGCEGKYLARGFCVKHYHEWRRTSGLAVCLVDGCAKPVHGRGLCDTHYARWLHHGSSDVVLQPKMAGGATGECRIDGCQNKAKSVGLCVNHYALKRKHGSPEIKLPNARRLEAHERWKGNDASYSAIHHRVKNNRGKASAHQCRRCPKMALHWAFDHQNHEPTGTLPNGVVFSGDIDAYIPLCGSCHSIFDRSRRAITVFAKPA